MYISNIVRLDLIETKVGVLTYEHIKTNGGNLKIAFIETMLQQCRWRSEVTYQILLTLYIHTSLYESHIVLID